MLIFAFGSNLDLAQMRRRCPTARAVEAAVLPGHRLAFAGWSERWGGAVATIERARRKHTLGALYDVGIDDLLVLDAHEGHPHHYQRVGVRVRTCGAGARAYAYAYQLQAGQPGAPSAAYRDAIARGYDAWGLAPSALDAAVLAATQAACGRPTLAVWTGEQGALFPEKAPNLKTA